MTPMLKTERLLLRGFRPRDAPAVQEHCGDRDVARMLSRVPHPYSLDMAVRWIASQGAASSSGGEIDFCIEQDGGAVGAVALRRTAAGTFELGYWLGKAWWGKGFATEAVRHAVRFAFEELGADRLTSGHFLDNPASGRVLEKCGFSYTGQSMEHSEARGAAAAHMNFQYARRDWQARTDKS